MFIIMLNSKSIVEILWKFCMEIKYGNSNSIGIPIHIGN